MPPKLQRKSSGRRAIGPVCARCSFKEIINESEADRWRKQHENRETSSACSEFNWGHPQRKWNTACQGKMNATEQEGTEGVMTGKRCIISSLTALNRNHIWLQRSTWRTTKEIDSPPPHLHLFQWVGTLVADQMPMINLQIGEQHGFWSWSSHLKGSAGKRTVSPLFGIKSLRDLTTNLGSTLCLYVEY